MTKIVCSPISTGFAFVSFSFTGLREHHPKAAISSLRILEQWHQASSHSYSPRVVLGLASAQCTLEVKVNKWKRWTLRHVTGPVLPIKGKTRLIREPIHRTFLSLRAPSGSGRRFNKQSGLYHPRLGYFMMAGPLKTLTG
jgi:hypothetical protein